MEQAPAMSQEQYLRLHVDFDQREVNRLLQNHGLRLRPARGGYMVDLFLQASIMWTVVQYVKLCKYYTNLFPYLVLQCPEPFYSWQGRIWLRWCALLRFSCGSCDTQQCAKMHSWCSTGCNRWQYQSAMAMGSPMPPVPGMPNVPMPPPSCIERSMLDPRTSLHKYAADKW